jgi:methionyl-tRNA formyltransferase
MRRVYALCTTSAGADIVRAISGTIDLAGVIGLGPGYRSNGISGFVDMTPLALELGVPFISVETYELDSPSDVVRLQKEKMDVLLVVGWQRLIPGWLITQCSEGALGIHGSPGGISAGRGRSPQNWALMLGASEIELSLFLIDEGVDSGNVISSETFQYEQDDDINVSYLKAGISSSNLIVRALKSGKELAPSSTPQAGEFFYFPQRLPEDGAIDWSRSSEEICRFVRALTHPYPGAFTWLGDNKVVIWKARAFNGFQSLLLGDGLPETPGKVVFESSAGLIVVKTADGYILSESWSLESGAKIGGVLGEVFASVDWQEQLRGIVARHQKRYPEFPISPLLLEQITDVKTYPKT